MSRIAILCGHYMPEAGYYEVHIAETLARIGHEIRVFTSNRSNLNLKQEKIYPSGLAVDHLNNLEIQRFKPYIKLGSTIISKGLISEVRKFKPELVLVIGVAKLFPIPVLLSKREHNFLIYTFFGENNEYYTWHNYSAIIKHSIKYLTRKILKRPFYELAIKASDKIFLYTPETFDFLSKLIGKTSTQVLQSKAVNTSLGFNEAVFFFDSKERVQVRDKEGIADTEFVILTVTRYSKSKSLEFMIDKIAEFRKKGYPVKYWIIGFNDEDSLAVVRRYIHTLKADEFINCYPFMTYDKLRKYQSASDIGIWCQVTISIQQSMGTGLPVLLEEKKSVSHLVDQELNGLFFSKHSLSETLIKGYQSFRPQINIDYEQMRKEIEKSNRVRFSYRNLVKHIISI